MQRPRFNTVHHGNLKDTPKFDFFHSEDWLKWIQRFERLGYDQVSGLYEKGDKNQVNMLIYTGRPR